jgi:cobalt ABC transporter, permease protein CbiQ
MSKLTESLNKINSLEELSEGNTVIHKLHPMAKMITTIVYMVVVISFDKYDISAMIPLFLYPILMMSLGEIPYRSVLSRLLIALPFSFFAGLSNPFFDREIAVSLIGLPVSYGFLSLISIIIKTVLTVMAVLILIATTPMDKLSSQLIRAKVPKMFVMQIMLTYRYLGLLITEVRNMVTAYHLRSGRQKGIRLVHAGTFMGQLLLRSFERAEKVYLAMKCRGFDGEYRFAASKPVRLWDYCYGILVCCVIVLFRFVNFSLLIGSLFG